MYEVNEDIEDRESTINAIPPQKQVGPDQTLLAR